MVDLQSLESIFSYVDNVPQSYHHYTKQLSICTKPSRGSACPDSFGNDTAISDALSRLLASCTQVVQLSLSLEGSINKSLISLFENFQQLKTLSIHHCGDEQRAPL